MRKICLLIALILSGAYVKAQVESDGSVTTELILDSSKPEDREKNLRILENLDDYTKVEVLKLYNMEDTVEVDKAMRKVKELRRLRVLEFHNVKFTRFPNGIDACRDLQSIVIDRCPIERLSKDIGGLNMLVNLQVTNSALKALPRELGDCPSLQIVNVSNDSIRFLSSDIFSLYRLEKFYVGNNKLTRLPEEIGKLKSLEELDITGCRFRNAEKEMGKLEPIKHLKSLIIKDCDLVEVPKVVQNFQDLERLILDDNIIEDFPEFLFSMPKLNYISVQGCRIQAATLEKIKSRLPNVDIVGEPYVYR